MSPVIIIILGTLLIAGWLWIQTKPAHQRTGAIIKLTILLLVAVLVILTVTGRIHWIGALFGGLLLLVKKYSYFIFKLLPFLNQIFRSKTNQSANHQEQANLNTHEMSRKEALDILGLKEGCTAEEVLSAHRRLMQKVHPDHGGNSYLASQLNEARALLMKEFK